MTRIYIRIIALLLILLVFGLLVGWVVSARIGLDLFKFARDTATGYQSDHPRHSFPPSQAVHWDPIGDHNAAVAVIPPNDRAYPLIAEAVARLRAMPNETWEKKPGTMVPDFIWAKPGDDEWPRLVEWMETEPVRAAMALVREATGKPELGAPFSVRDDPEWVAILDAHGVSTTVDPTPPPVESLMIGVLVPHLGWVRGLGGISDAHARLAIERQEPAAFMDAIEDILGLASHASEPNILISQIVRVALLVTASERIGETLVDHPGLIDDDAAARFDALLADAVDAGWTSLEPAVELVTFEDVIRRMVDDRGVFDPLSIEKLMRAIDDPAAFSAPRASTAPLAAFSTDLLASYRMAEWYAGAGEEASRAPFSPYPITEEDMDWWAERPLLLKVLNPKWSKAAATFRKVDQHLLGVRVALAAHRHQLRHGEPPASLDAIDPDLLAFDPVDGFTGGRLVYRRTDAGHLVYALGADHDDDDGRHAADPEGEPVSQISDEYLTGEWDGDWVVFPKQD